MGNTNTNVPVGDRGPASHIHQHELIDTINAPIVKSVVYQQVAVVLEIILDRRLDGLSLDLFSTELPRVTRLDLNVTNLFQAHKLLYPKLVRRLELVRP